MSRGRSQPSQKKEWPWDGRQPTLQSLHVLEAWLRHGGKNNETVAEIGATPGAITHALETLLETAFGEKFIEQDDKHRYVPTDEAKNLGSELTKGFSIICSAVRKYMPEDVLLPLKILTVPAIWHQWLIPRKDKWDEKHRRTFDAKTKHADKPFVLEHGTHAIIDVARPPQTAGLKIEYFAHNKCGPVCSPFYLEKLGFAKKRDGRFKMDIKDLDKMTYLRPKNRDELLGQWLDAKGKDTVIKPKNVVSYDRLFYALQAAKGRQGFAIGRELYVKDDIDRGELVAPFGMIECGGMSWFLAYPEKGFEPELTQFLSWLRAETGWNQGTVK